MSNVEQLLRDELNHLAGRPQPDATRMLTRVHRTRRRHHITTTAIVVLIALTGTLLWPRITPPPAPALATIDGVPADATAYAHNIRFPDTGHGYALLTSCSTQPCTLWFATTADGGNTWHGAQVPGATAPADLGPALIVIGPGIAVIDLNDPLRTRLYTADTGTTWQPRSTQPDGTIEQIPTGGIATISGDEGHPLAIAVLKPDGTTSMLTNPPPAMPTIGTMDSVVHQASDSSVWIQGTSDQQALHYVSRDRGRTWTLIPLPDGAAGPDPLTHLGSRIFTADGRHAYLADSAGYRIWRTTDDGGTWQEIPIPFPKPEADWIQLAMALADGGLMLAADREARTTYRVSADGTQFQPTDPPRTGLVGVHHYDFQTKAHSADGENWIPFPFRIG